MTMTGKDLRKRRIALELSQQKLADLLGIDVGTISRWERGVLTIERPDMVSLALDGVFAKWYVKVNADYMRERLLAGGLTLKKANEMIRAQGWVK